MVMMYRRPKENPIPCDLMRSQLHIASETFSTIDRAIADAFSLLLVYFIGRKLRCSPIFDPFWAASALFSHVLGCRRPSDERHELKQYAWEPSALVFPLNI